MKVAGIDYSLTSPAIAIYDGVGSLDRINSFYFMYLNHDKKKIEHIDLMNLNIVGYELDKSLVHDNQQKRYEVIADYFVNAVKEHSVDVVYIEDYSFGSRGKVFHIAENAGLLKYKLYKEGIQVETVAPTRAKKFATGKGNANKISMYEYFKETTKEDFSLLVKKDIPNPYSDLIDAYWICRYGIDDQNNT